MKKYSYIYGIDRSTFKISIELHDGQFQHISLGRGIHNAPVGVRAIVHAIVVGFNHWIIHTFATSAALHYADSSATVVSVSGSATTTLS